MLPARHHAAPNLGRSHLTTAPHPLASSLPVTSPTFDFSFKSITLLQFKSEISFSSWLLSLVSSIANTAHCECQFTHSRYGQSTFTRRSRLGSPKSGLPGILLYFIHHSVQCFTSHIPGLFILLSEDNCCSLERLCKHLLDCHISACLFGPYFSSLSTQRPV